jgi:hypothetical protein
LPASVPATPPVSILSGQGILAILSSKQAATSKNMLFQELDWLSLNCEDIMRYQIIANAALITLMSIFGVAESQSEIATDLAADSEL